MQWQGVVQHTIDYNQHSYSDADCRSRCSPRHAHSSSTPRDVLEIIHSLEWLRDQLSTVYLLDKQQGFFLFTANRFNAWLT